MTIDDLKAEVGELVALLEVSARQSRETDIKNAAWQSMLSVLFVRHYLESPVPLGQAVTDREALASTYRKIEGGEPFAVAIEEIYSHLLKRIENQDIPTQERMGPMDT